VGEANSGCLAGFVLLKEPVVGSVWRDKIKRLDVGSTNFLKKKDKFLCFILDEKSEKFLFFHQL